MSKASKRRQCPALGREIARNECGEQRHSQLRCPASCAHNPFVVEHYGELLDVEDQLDRKSMEWLLDEPGRSPAAKRELLAAYRKHPGLQAHPFVMWQLFGLRDAQGLTCADRWQQARFPGLNNDERVLFQAKSQSRVALLEIHRVLDSQRVEAVDLLRPEAGPLLLCDRNLAATTARFAFLFVWIYPLPHFWRLSGSATLIPELGVQEPDHVLLQTILHLGGPEAKQAQGVWLAEHFERVSRSLQASDKEYTRRMIESADIQRGVAHYSLQSPLAECRALLAGEPEADCDETSPEEQAQGFSEAWDWFDDSAPKTAGRLLIGRVLVGQAQWRLEASSQARLALLRKRFEKRFGKRMKFEWERRDDVASRTAAKFAHPDQSLVPPALFNEVVEVQFNTTRVDLGSPSGSRAEMEARYLAEFLRGYADQPVPALDGRTPREAAANPAMRERLLCLMKPVVRRIDEHNLRNGQAVDINGLLAELGLAEINFPPPPQGRVPLRATKDPLFEGLDDLDDWDEEDDSNEPERSGQPAEASSPDVLTMDQAMQRVQAAMDRFETAGEAMDALFESGSSMISDLTLLTEDILSEKDASTLVPFAIQAWFALVQPGVRSPDLDYENMEAALRQELERIPLLLLQGEARVVENIVANCRQPGLLECQLGQLSHLVGRSRKGDRISHEAFLPMVLILKVLINEIDRALNE